MKGAGPGNWRWYTFYTWRVKRLKTIKLLNHELATELSVSHLPVGNFFCIFSCECKFLWWSSRCQRGMVQQCTMATGSRICNKPQQHQYHNINRSSQREKWPESLRVLACRGDKLPLAGNSKRSHRQVSAPELTIVVIRRNQLDIERSPIQLLESPIPPPLSSVAKKRSFSSSNRSTSGHWAGDDQNFH